MRWISTLLFSSFRVSTISDQLEREEDVTKRLARLEEQVVTSFSRLLLMSRSHVTRSIYYEKQGTDLKKKNKKKTHLLAHNYYYFNVVSRLCVFAIIHSGMIPLVFLGMLTGLAPSHQVVQSAKALQWIMDSLKSRGFAAQEAQPSRQKLPSSFILRQFTCCTFPVLL